MLHCHRSLGVGLYDVAMLLAELETKMKTKSMWLPCFWCCVVAANSSWICLLWWLWSSKFDLYAVGTGYCTELCLESKLTSRTCILLVRHWVWDDLLMPKYLAMGYLCWYWLLYWTDLESKLATYTTISQANLHWLHAVYLTSSIPTKCLCRDVELRDISIGSTPDW